MFERLNRRMDALGKKIEADKKRAIQPNNGLTVPTDVEVHQAKQHERRQADFSETEPAVAGTPLFAIDWPADDGGEKWNNTLTIIGPWQSFSVPEKTQDRGEPEPITTSPWLVDHS